MVDKLLCGLIGAGIQRSLTPAMQEAEAAAQGLRLHYQLIDLDADASTRGRGIEPLPGLIAAARTMGFAGLNITYPCKQAVIPLLDTLSDEARAMGAVNTVVFDGGRATGHNTDGSGWRWGFERTLPSADLSRVVLLGGGGAGSAIAHSLCRMGAAALTIVDSDGVRAQALADELGRQYPTTHSRGSSDAAESLQGASGVVHATPTGMDKLPGLPIDAALLQPSMWLSEIVYFPLETELLRTARALGCRTLDGGGMAVYQAVEAFRLFTGIQPDAQRMLRHFADMGAG